MNLNVEQATCLLLFKSLEWVFNIREENLRVSIDWALLELARATNLQSQVPWGHLLPLVFRSVNFQRLPLNALHQTLNNRLVALNS